MTYTDIFQAVRRADFEQLKKLFDTEDLTVVTADKRNLLHMAIAHRRPEVAIELIERGVDVNWPDQKGQTPLHYAATYGYLEIAQLILKKGGKPSVVDKHGNTPLWNAVFNARGKYEIVVLLAQNGSAATLKNKHGHSPIDFARQINDREMVDILVKGH